MLVVARLFKNLGTNHSGSSFFMRIIPQQEPPENYNLACRPIFISDRDLNKANIAFFDSVRPKNQGLQNACGLATLNSKNIVRKERAAFGQPSLSMPKAPFRRDQRFTPPTAYHTNSCRNYIGIMCISVVYWCQKILMLITSGVIPMF